ncbi:Rdm16, partial [Thalictrum thalictroides]
MGEPIREVCTPWCRYGIEVQKKCKNCRAVVGFEASNMELPDFDGDGTQQIGSNKEKSKVPSSSIGTQPLLIKHFCFTCQAICQWCSCSYWDAAIPNIEAVKRAQELAARMGFHHDPGYGPAINMFPGQIPTDVTVQQKPSKAPVLRLDQYGNEIDEH